MDRRRFDEISHSSASLTAALLAGMALAASSCASGPEPEAESNAVVQSAIVGPASASLPNFPSVVTLANTTKTCSGVVVGAHSILTAGSCFTPANWPKTTTYSGSGINSGDTIAGVTANLFQDLEIVTTNSTGNIPAEPVRLFNGTMDSSWVGRQVYMVGSGNANNDPSARSGGWTTITSVSPYTYTLGSAGTVWSCGIDQGGPSLINLNGRWYIIGIHSAVSPAPGCSFSSNPIVDTRIDFASAWIRSLTAVRGDDSSSPVSRNDASAWGDIDGDGNPDLIALNPQLGVTVYFWSDGSAWSTPISTGEGGQQDLALGDVDQDGRADLFVLGGQGLSVYRSLGTSFDLAHPLYTNPALQVGYTNMQVADFNGDSKADVLLVGVGGSSVYVSNGSTLVSSWTDATKRVFTTKATVADFDGSGAADVMFQDDTGAQLWTGATDGALHDSGYRNAAWTRGNAALSAGRFISSTGRDLVVVGGIGTGMELYQVGLNPFSFTRRWSNTGLIMGFDSITVGNFGGPNLANGATLDDILITDHWGSFLYLMTGNPASPINGNVWIRYDLNWENTEYAATDWSGDGISDLVIVTGAAWWYQGQPSGIFTPNVWWDSTLRFQAIQVN
jgi:hypothetical protein